MNPSSFWLAWHVSDEDDFVLCAPAPASALGKSPHEAFRQAYGGGVGVVLPYNSQEGAREVLAAPLRYGERCFAVIAVERPIFDAHQAALDLQYLVGVAGCAGPLVRAVERLEQLRRDAEQDLDKSVGGAVLLGDTPSMSNARAALMTAARGRGNVLILGETGVGKELAARYVHDHSARAEGPYVVVNCAAIPSALIESELFGHAVGAFTDAARRRRGLFQIAHGGTLFLDEIGELSSENQARLLRVVETGVFRPVGSDDELEVNVRVVAASNRPLRDPSSGFRPDLLHRIGAFVVELPPLRDHAEDIPALARHFLEVFAAHAPAHLSGFTPDALETLRNQRWPGNVRELRNTIERACQTSRGPWIAPSDLGTRPRAVVAEGGEETFLPLDAHEKRHILRIFESCNRNIAETSRILGIARSTLYSKLNTYGVQLQ
ncbi:MAG: sigma-54 dependent transcriptional regulator [Candidatus Hydrogenedentales bacterium]